MSDPQLLTKDPKLERKSPLTEITTMSDLQLSTKDRYIGNNASDFAKTRKGSPWTLDKRNQICGRVTTKKV